MTPIIRVISRNAERMFNPDRSKHTLAVRLVHYISFEWLEDFLKNKLAQLFSMLSLFAEHLSHQGHKSRSNNSDCFFLRYIFWKIEWFLNNLIQMSSMISKCVERTFHQGQLEVKVSVKGQTYFDWVSYAHCIS